MNWTFWTRTEPTPLDDCGTVDPLLSAYADGMADADATRRVEAHLPGCAGCRESLAWARATQRALSSRPVAAPPAELRERIALAIAASDAAPVPAFAVRSARAFVLRPAFAAAASLVVVGILGYGLMHKDVPAVVAPVVVVPSRVATVPTVSHSPVTVKPTTVPTVKTAARHPVSHPKHTDVDPALLADTTPHEMTSHPAIVKTHAEPKADPHKMASVAPAPALAKPAVALVKKLTPHKSTVALMVTTKAPTFSAETHRPLIIKHETRKPETVIATVPHTPTVTAPALIEKTPIITRDPAPTVTVASNNGGGRFQTAEDHGRIRLNLALGTFTHQTLGRIDKGSVIAAGVGLDRSATQPIVNIH